MYLLVKDTSISHAIASARKRGIASVTEVKQNGHFPYEHKLKCSGSYLDKIVKWFCEDASAPYPMGTLMFYWDKNTGLRD